MNETDFTPDNLPDDVDLLKQMLVNLAHKSAQETSHLETEIKQLTSRLAYLEHKFPQSAARAIWRFVGAIEPAWFI